MSNDINAARERLEKARERRNGWPSDQPSLLRDHVFAISDLLLAMTAPAASPATPAVPADDSKNPGVKQ